MKHWLVVSGTEWVADDDLENAVRRIKKRMNKGWNPNAAWVYLVPGWNDRTEYAIDHYRWAPTTRAPVGVGAQMVGIVKHSEDA